MKKFITCMALAVIVVLSSFAESGLMAGQQDIKYVSTEYFDIIYPEASARSAAELASRADAVLEDICAGLGVKVTVGGRRLPVVISPATDQFNAYYNDDRYNHIVLFDTVPEADMLVNDSTIVETFRHELDHFVTINMKNGFWSFLGNVFGDSLNWGSLVVMPSLITEGAAVTCESKGGMGRLHDEYYLQTVRQAKIENKFPSWSDVAGARDMYPAGSSAYAFGGPFTDWLQNTYGMEKYARYWYRAVNMQSLTFATSFINVYGVSISTAWKQFKESVAVPAVDANPLTVDGVDDFFSFIRGNFQSGAFADENKRGSVYGSVTGSDGGIAYADGASGAVYFAAKQDDGTYGAPRKLFSEYNVSGLSLSKDNALLAVSVYGINHPVIKNEMQLYSMKDGATYSIHETGLRDGTIICVGERKYLVAVKTLSQQVSLAVYELALNGGASVSEAVLLSTVDLPRGDVVVSMCDAGDGKVACIYKTGMAWSVRVLSGLCAAAAEVDETIYALPEENMRMRNISLVSADGEAKKFAFSYTVPGSLPRLGYLAFGDDSTDGTFMLMRTDVSGGVYYPVAFRCADSNRGQLPSVAYVGSFFTDSKLLVVNGAKIDFEEVPVAASVQRVPVYDEEAVSFSSPVLAGAKKYTKLYNDRGILIPMSVANRYGRSLLNYSGAFPGVTWLTGNVWDSAQFGITGGYDTANDTGVFGLLFSGAEQTSLFSYKFNPAVSFDAEGFKQASLYASAQTGVQVGRVSSFVVQDVAQGMAGRPDGMGIQYGDPASEDVYAIDEHQYLAGLNQLTVQYSNIHSTGPGTYEKGGFALGAGYQTYYLSYLQNVSDSKKFFHDVYPYAEVRLPRILPVICGEGMTYNLPVVCLAQLLPDYDRFMTAQAQLVLFSTEIQKGCGYLPLFFNRFTATFEYDCSLWYGHDSFEIVHLLNDFTKVGTMPLSHLVGLNLTFDVSGNTGAFCQYSQTAGVYVDYNLSCASDVFPWSFGFVASLLF